MTREAGPGVPGPAVPRRTFLLVHRSHRLPQAQMGALVAPGHTVGTLPGAVMLVK